LRTVIDCTHLYFVDGSWSIGMVLCLCTEK
jgi:hypothetical protein